MSSPALSAGVPWPMGHVTLSVAIPILISSVLTGVVLSMLISYISRFGGRDKLQHHGLVALIVLALLIKTALDWEFLWDTIVEDQATQLGGELTVSLAVAFIPVIVPQIWLLYRVHVLSERRWPFTITGGILVLASFISFTGLLITKRTDWTIFLDSTFHHWWIAYASTAAIADLFLSSAYIFSIVRLRKRTGDPRFKSFLTVMLGVAISSFSLTALMSVAFFIAVAITIESPIFSAFLSLMPALNCISVLFTLNSRTRTAVDDSSPTQASAHTVEVNTTRRRNVSALPQEHSPSSSFSQTASGNSSAQQPWCKIAVEKETQVTEEVDPETVEQEPRPVSPQRSIPRKEPPRFEV